MNLDTKRRAIGAFERNCHEIEGRLRALMSAPLDHPVWTGEGSGWRIRDLIPHLARWNRIAAPAARLIAAGKEPLPEAAMRLGRSSGSRPRSTR